MYKYDLYILRLLITMLTLFLPVTQYVATAISIQVIQKENIS